MVTRVPGERGCSRSSCPPEHPTQAPEPQLMPTQYPASPIWLLWGPAWIAMSTSVIVLRACLPPGYYQGQGRKFQARVPSSSPSKPVLTCFHPEKFYQYFVSPVPTNPSGLLEPEGLLVTAQKGPEAELRPFGCRGEH